MVGKFIEMLLLLISSSFGLALVVVYIEFVVFSLVSVDIGFIFIFLLGV